MTDSHPISEELSQFATKVLNERAQKLRKTFVDYRVERVGGEDHCPVFLAIAVWYPERIYQEGVGNTKNTAKKAASYALLGLLDYRERNPYAWIPRLPEDLDLTKIDLKVVNHLCGKQDAEEVPPFYFDYGAKKVEAKQKTKQKLKTKKEGASPSSSSSLKHGKSWTSKEHTSVLASKSNPASMNGAKLVGVKHLSKNEMRLTTEEEAEEEEAHNDSTKGKIKLESGIDSPKLLEKQPNVPDRSLLHSSSMSPITPQKTEPRSVIHDDVSEAGGIGNSMKMEHKDGLSTSLVSDEENIEKKEESEMPAPIDASIHPRKRARTDMNTVSLQGILLCVDMDSVGGLLPDLIKACNESERSLQLRAFGCGKEYDSRSELPIWFTAEKVDDISSTSTESILSLRCGMYLGSHANGCKPEVVFCSSSPIFESTVSYLTAAGYVARWVDSVKGLEMFLEGADSQDPYSVATS